MENGTDMPFPFGQPFDKKRGLVARSDDGYFCCQQLCQYGRDRAVIVCCFSLLSQQPSSRRRCVFDRSVIELADHHSSEGIILCFRYTLLTL